MKKDIFRVFGSNLIKMIVTFITAFVVPMVLSVEQYGYLKLYQFYVTYLGISHLGFCDGVYLEYGGQDIALIDKRRMAKEQKTLLAYESFIMCVFLLVGVLKQDFVIVLLGFTVVPSVMFTYYTYMYQATGDFKTYTRIINTSTIVNLVVNFLLVVFSFQDYRVYVVAYCLVQYVSCLIGYVSFRKNGWIDYKEKGAFDVLTKYIQMGILLMIGNFVYTIFLGITQWFIKFTLDITQFSLYSFGAQMMTLVNMIITPIAMTLYSNMRSRMDKAFEIKVKNILIGILMITPVSMYVIKFIIQNYIEKYKEVIPIMSVLVITQIFMCLNTAVFVNLYKVYKKQSAYFVRLAVAVGVAIILDFIVYYIHPSIIGYAIASLISCIVWLLENLYYFKYMRFQIKEILFVIVLLGVFISTFMFVENFVFQILIYLGAYMLCLWIWMQDVFVFIKQTLVSILGRVKNTFVK